MQVWNYPRFNEWLSQAANRLTQVGIENAKIDTEYLLSYVTCIPRLQLSLHANQTLTLKQYQKIETLLERRLQREPLQYIMKSVDFYGLNIHINKHVLIPRPETEFLVDMIVKGNSEPASILDIGTGSGAIALALKHVFPESQVSGVDVSMPALRMAIANGRRLCVGVKFKKSDVYSKIKGKFDIIVSNPPYLTEEEYSNTSPEVMNYEPKLALQANDYGLEVYQKILEKASEHLNSKGKIYLEIGYKQAESISFLAQKYGFTSMEIQKDLNKFDRYFIIRT